MKSLSLFLTFAAMACTTTTTPTDGQCPYPANTVTNASGLLHGIACTDNSQCKYGVCTKTAMQQGKSSTTGVCTKQCSCGINSQCSDDNDANKGLEFTCIFASSGPGRECGVVCKNDTDCKNINSNQPFCIDSIKGVLSSGARKICASKPDS